MPPDLYLTSALVAHVLPDGYRPCKGSLTEDLADFQIRQVFSKEWNEDEARDGYQRHDHGLSISESFTHDAVDEESCPLY
jgi:hypothetical protein